MKRFKLLELTAFSAGICGVWARVFTESSLLSKKGYEVYVFSSDIIRGEGLKKIASESEEIERVKIKRFPTKGSFGQNTFFWNCSKEIFNLKPNIIITHAYRQYYSTLALKIAKKLKIPCFLVTHAPFLKKRLRNWRLNLIVYLYDKFIGKRILNNYKKIIAITKWEIPFLLKLGVKKEKIAYIPNGISDEFFRIKKTKEIKNKILFLGRIAPIKDLETLIKALSETKDFKLTLVGPVEEPYGKKLSEIIKKLKLTDRVKFKSPIYNLKDKIKIIDENEILVLPSKREGMPQTLVEALARGKIVVSSDSDGGKEIIEDNKNGYLFKIGNSEQLSDILKKIQILGKEEKNKIKKQAKEKAKEFAWSKLINKIEKILNET